jgi:S-adenosylmethionine-dependent methyltransferase
MPEADEWAPIAQRFARDHYASVRGQVRLHVIGTHLRAHLPPPPATLVDVGGGGGNQSIPLAAAGYRVTILDPSAAMLAQAEARLGAEGNAVAGRVRLVQASAETARSALGAECFDGVLCHGVIMYVDDPRPFIEALADLAEPGGVLSLVAKNARCLAVRPALEGRWSDALAALDADRQVNGLGLDTRGDTVEQLSALLAEYGVDPVAWYGVRLFAEWAASPDLTADLLAVEAAASSRDPYRQLSRLFHLVGIRGGPT